MMMRMTWTRWKRVFWQWLCVTAAFVLLFSLLSYVDQSLSARQQSIEELQKNTVIRCTLSARDGRTDNIGLSNGITYQFMYKEEANRFLGTLSIRSSEAAKTAIGEATLDGVTAARLTELCDNERKEPIRWVEGYSPERFDGTENICVIGEKYLATARTLASGRQAVAATLSHESCEEKEFEVVGYSERDDAFLIPWRTMYDWSIAIRAESFAFALKDNALLPEWLEYADARFGKPGQTGYPNTAPAVITDDEAYRQLTQTGNRNLMIMEIAKPFFFLLIMGLAAFVSGMVMRIRATEIAMLRGLGVSIGFLTAQGLIENILPCVLAGLLLRRVLPVSTAEFVFLLLAFTVGYALPLLSVSAKPILSQIKSLKGETT